jgi:hypothetical protein
MPRSRGERPSIGCRSRSGWRFVSRTHARPIPRRKLSGQDARKTAGGPRGADNAPKPGGQAQHCEGQNPMSAVGRLRTARLGHATSAAGSGTSPARIRRRMIRGGRRTCGRIRAIRSRPASAERNTARATVRASVVTSVTAGRRDGERRSGIVRMLAAPDTDSAAWLRCAEGKRTSREADGSACRRTRSCPRSDDEPPAVPAMPRQIHRPPAHARVRAAPERTLGHTLKRTVKPHGPPRGGTNSKGWRN